MEANGNRSPEDPWNGFFVSEEVYSTVRNSVLPTDGNFSSDGYGNSFLSSLCL